MTPTRAAYILAMKLLQTDVRTTVTEREAIRISIVEYQKVDSPNYAEPR